jgi:hypothetical protein
MWFFSFFSPDFIPGKLSRLGRKSLASAAIQQSETLKGVCYGSVNEPLRLGEFDPVLKPPELTSTDAKNARAKF